MAASLCRRSFLAHIPRPTPQPSTPRSQQQRPLLTSLLNGKLTPPQTLHAHRILPYSTQKVYQLISDIDSYHRFLPHCAASCVTHWTDLPHYETNNDQKPLRWPAQADLKVRWGPFTESYTSRVYCVPNCTVEAVSGTALPTLTATERALLGLSPHDRPIDPSRPAAVSATGIIQSLVTRWTLEPAAGREGEEWSRVMLSVRFKFTNPALGLATGTVGGEKVAEMIEAFETRAKQLLG